MSSAHTTAVGTVRGDRWIDSQDSPGDPSVEVQCTGTLLGVVWAVGFLSRGHFTITSRPIDVATHILFTKGLSVSSDACVAVKLPASPRRRGTRYLRIMIGPSLAASGFSDDLSWH